MNQLMRKNYLQGCSKLYAADLVFQRPPASGEYIYTDVQGKTPQALRNKPQERNKLPIFPTTLIS